MKRWQQHGAQLMAVALMDVFSTLVALRHSGAQEVNPLMRALTPNGFVAFKLITFSLVVVALPFLEAKTERILSLFGIYLTGAVVLSNLVQLGIFIDPSYAAVGLPVLLWTIVGPYAIASFRQAAAKANQSANSNAQN